MEFLNVAFVIALCTVGAQCVFFHSNLNVDQDKSLTREAHWMEQKLDHFATQGTSNFSQRYYEFTDYFVPDGPIFLHICGESACGGISNDYMGVLAKKFNAAIVSLEHRYYGKSSPVENFTTENLQFLSSKQALYDLATFRDYYQGLVRRKYNSEEDNPWFVFGVSYSGALSAWFRLKFPHLVYGSIASSGVVKAIFDYTAFDEQISISAGPECSAALRAVTKLVEKGLRHNSTATKMMFNAQQLKVDGDFMYLLADAAAIAFQYGNPDILCSPLVKANNTNQNLLVAYAAYVNDYYINSFGSSIATYDQESLKNASSSDRLWWYQVCTEVAYFQTAPQNYSIRSSLVDIKYHLDLCSNVFGEGIYPKVDDTNLYYGGEKIASSRILFMNGSQDPWRHASKQSSSRGETSYLVECYNCAHGVDMRGCPQVPFQLEGNTSKCADPRAAKLGQNLVALQLESWLHDYHSLNMPLSF